MGEYMGRGALVLLLSTGSGIMKVIWVAVLVTLILVVQTEAKGKGKGKKPGKPKPTGKCPVDSTSTKQFEKFTVTKKVGGKTKPQADQACWWNASLNECAKCKSGGIQCGFPMHKWCQSKKSKVVSISDKTFSLCNFVFRDVREFLITSTHSQLLDTLATGTLRA